MTSRGKVILRLALNADSSTASSASGSIDKNVNENVNSNLENVISTSSKGDDNFTEMNESYQDDGKIVCYKILNSFELTFSTVLQMQFDCCSVGTTCCS